MTRPSLAEAAATTAKGVSEAALHRALNRFWHPVMYADEVSHRPAPAMLLGEPLVVVRLGDQVVAFRDLCIHRGTALSLGWTSDGLLVCPYHGWHYNSEGVCVRIPASHGDNIPRKARVKRYRAREAAGLVWVCLADAEPPLPIPDCAAITDPGYRVVKIPTYDWACGPARRIENFVDFSHFAWVHEGILGDRSRPESPEHAVHRDERTLQFEIALQEPTSPLKGDTDGGIRVQRDITRYTIHMPLSVTLDQHLPDGKHFILFLACCPIAENRTRNFTLNARNYDLDPTRDAEFVEFQQVILDQDRPVVESQRPEELPVDLTEELHIRGVDRVSIDYRRWLRQLATERAATA